MKKLLSFIVLGLFTVHTATAQKEFYAVQTDPNQLVFYYDESREDRGGETDWHQYDNRLFYNPNAMTNNITNIAFDESVKDYVPESMENWFSYFSKLEKIDNLEFLNTANVTTMSGLFNYCQKLKSLDLSGFDTRNVTDMSSLFSSCWELETIDMSGWNTQNVENMSSMFYECSKLEEIELSHFGFDKLKSSKYMFNDCQQLTTIFCGSDFNDCALLTETDDMFYRCFKLVGGKGTVFDKNKTGMEYARPDGKDGQKGYFTKKLPSVTLYAVANGNTFTIYYDNLIGERNGDKDWTVNMTDEDKELITRVVFDKSVKEARPVSTSYWFYDFINLTEIEHLDFLNTADVTQMNNMFGYCTALQNLDVTGFDTRNVTDMSYMFNYCESLQHLNLNGFDTENVRFMEYMFNGCSTLETIDLSGFTTYGLWRTSNMFSYCTSLQEINLGNFTTAEVYDASEMFAGCPNLKAIYCSIDWSRNDMMTDADMFLGCEQLKGEQGTEFDWIHTGREYARPDGQDDQPGYFTTEKTALEEMNAPVKKAEKILTTNGHLHILRNGQVFDIQGRRVK